MNREREAAGEETFANPRNTAAGTMKTLDTKVVSKRGLDIFLYSVAHVRGTRLTGQWQALETPALLGPAHQHDLAPVPRPGRGAGLHRGVAGQARLARIRHRRRGGEGRLVRLAAGARLHVEVPALGHRVQVRGAPGPTVVREIGSTSAARASSRRWPPGAGRRWRAPRSRRASLFNEEEVARKDVRKGDTVLIEKGGDVIPKVVQVVVEGKRPPDTEPWKPPDGLPGLRHGGREGGGRGRSPLPERLLPGAGRGAAQHFARRHGHGHRGAGRGHRPRAAREGPGARTWPTSTA